MNRSKLLFFFFFFFFCFKIKAQQAYGLEIVSPPSKDIVKKLEYKKIFSSKEERKKELRSILFSLYDNAYLAANYDSLVEDSVSLRAYLNVGEIYRWVLLDRGNVDEGILSEIGFREKLYANKPLYFKDVLKVQEKIMSYCENNGYPFAAVNLDSINIHQNNISARLNLVKNIELHIDSILVKGSAAISSAYLHNYLSIKPGDFYNESLIKKISIRVKEMSFLTEARPSNIVFIDKQTKLFLFLEKKKASQFDGIIGILPDNTSNKILFTGDVHLKLLNALAKGELIDVNWRSLQKNTQDLKTKITYPFLFSTPFGLDYDFKLYKKDSLFIDVNQSFGLQYLLTGGSYFKAFVNTKQSSLLSTRGLEFQTVPPVYADISSTLYGLGYKTEKLDYRLNPRKGYTLNINGSAGNKNIKKNPKLNPVIYENIKLNSAQYNSDLELVFYIPLKNRSTIKIGTQSAAILGSSIFQNELFRMGGLKTLRGFDEESIYASAYSIFTLEYRYLMEQNSFLYLFFDGMYYENNNAITPLVHDTPYGFGSGISFETKAGIFSINYALGKQFDNPINLKSGKIHFGIVNYF